MAKVLVVDDEKMIVKGIRFSLEQDGMQVDCAYDGGEALEMARKTEYDVILLDVMLPVMDGLQVCSRIREFSNMPIIMLTARGEDADKILGLEYGADDYITKPFNILEVKARMRAIMRRNTTPDTAHKNRVLQYGRLRIDGENHQVYLSNERIRLTSKEYEILDLLMHNPDKVYSREELLELVWGKDYPGDARTVDVHIRRLREKIEENPGVPDFVLTKWGEGYYFNAH
ncbi:MAG: response regulator transcription factor [Lachnospiraceae bacterium]|nr:response regulator transcription factor [Lachnospiraceae bacterium]